MEPITVTGTVAAGKGRGGAELGYPTLNIAMDSGHPDDFPHGVYAARVTVRGGAYAGTHDSAVFIGPSKLMGQEEPLLEAHLLDIPVDADLSGRRVSVELLAHIRPAREFARTEDLRRQIAKDIIGVRRALAS